MEKLIEELKATKEKLSTFEQAEKDGYIRRCKECGSLRIKDLYMPSNGKMYNYCQECKYKKEW